jgi:hypothetical protein
MQTRYESILTIDNARQWQAASEQFLFCAGLLEYCNLVASLNNVRVLEQYFVELLEKA